jgi:hypothetical protein
MSEGPCPLFIFIYLFIFGGRRQYWGLNSELHACEEGTLPLEPLHHHPTSFSSKTILVTFVSIQGKISKQNKTKQKTNKAQV